MYALQKGSDAICYVSVTGFPDDSYAKTVIKVPQHTADWGEFVNDMGEGGEEALRRFMSASFNAGLDLAAQFLRECQEALVQDIVTLANNRHGKVFKPHTRAMLEQHGITHPWQLAMYTSGQWRQLDGVGQETAQEFADFLLCYGLTSGMAKLRRYLVLLEARTGARDLKLR